MTRLLKNFFIFIFLISFTCTAIFAESIVDEEFGFSLDIPEGYKLSDATEDGLSLLFEHPNIPVTLALKICFDDESGSPAPTLENCLNKIKANGDIVIFDWNNSPAAISNFTFKLDKNYEGYAVSAPVQSTKYPDAYVVLICYCPEDKFTGCSQFIFSTLNSLCVDMNNYNYPGIIVSYAFPKDDKAKKLPVNWTVGGKKITTYVSSVDIEASQFVVDMEYSVLLLYGNHELWKEAWQRYYRIIYRDNYGRLEEYFDLLYTTLWPIAKTKNPKQPELWYAQSLLTWVQNFDYKRAKTQSESDFTSLPAALAGEGNDCDSRSLLIAACLKYIGIESLLLIGPEYAHAMVVTEIEAPGQIYELEGTDRTFLFGETTAKVTWGMIAQDFADKSKWIPVILP